MDKFRHKLPKDELKKYAKDLGKKLVSSDYKNNRVTDPTKISDKAAKKVKQYVKDYLDKAVAKKHAHDKARKARKATEAAKKNATSDKSATATNQNDDAGVDIETSLPESGGTELEDSQAQDDSIEMDDPEMSDVDLNDDVPSSPLQPEEDDTMPSTPGEDNLKRKREESGMEEGSESLFKRIKDEDDTSAHTPPPPPPPPPMDEMPDEDENQADLDIKPEMSEADRSMAEQEAALIKENEDALKDEEAHAKTQLDLEQGLDHNISVASINDEAPPALQDDSKQDTTQIDAEMEEVGP